MFDSLNRIEKRVKKIEAWLPPRPIRYQNGSPQTKPKPPTLREYYKVRYPKYYSGGHIEKIHLALSDLQEGEGLILNMPPRHGKSDNVGALIENWYGINPTQTVIYASYTATLAQQRSRRIRNAIDVHPAFKKYYPNIHLSKESKARDYWETTAGGSFIACGVDGALTGMGDEANFIVLDDLIKGRKDAESPTVRRTTIDWVAGDLLSRVLPTTRLILIQTRWHTGDPTGWILKELEDDPEFLGLRWKQLIMPAISDEGKALWPEKIPLETLEKRRKARPYDFASIYQQNPIPKGGILFRDTHYYKELPKSKFRKAIAIDLAYTKRTHADYVVVIRGFYANETLYVADMQRLQSDIGTTTVILKQHQNDHGGYIHMRVGGQEGPILQLLEKEGLRIKYEKTVGDKFTNATTIVSRWNEGKIQLPENAPWIGDFLDEVLNFTGLDDEHDDIVDALITLDNVFTTKSKHGYKSGQALKSSIPAGGNN